MLTDPKMILKKLAQLTVDDQLVLFIGNDLPMGYPENAPPCRAELARELANELEQNADPPDPLPLVAQDYEDAYSRNVLCAKVRELVDQPGYRPSDLHRLAAALPIKGYVTCAFDHLLDEALRDSKRSTLNVVSNADTAFQGSADASIFRLMGDIQQIESLALTRSDYRGLPDLVELKLANILHFFTTKTILVINNRLDDELFETLYFRVKSKAGAFGRELYVVYPQCPTRERSFWSGKGAHVLEIEPQKFLEYLSQEVAARKRATPAEAPEALKMIATAPYKYLEEYEEKDQDIFYGRDTDALLVWGKILSFRTMMLFGVSGTGKSSLIKAGVIPRLRQVGYQVAVTRVLGDPLSAVKAAVCQARNQETRMPLELADFFAALPAEERWVICLDQFEEFFLFQIPTTRQNFIYQIATTLKNPERDVRFVFSLREDFVGRMDELRKHLPDLWINCHRLTQMGCSEAGLAIVAPAERAGLHYEPGLVDGENGILTQLSEDDLVAPPNLQIVCEKLYQSVQGQLPDQALALVKTWKKASPTLDIRFAVRYAVSRAQYEKMGRASGILRRHLDDRLAEAAPNPESRARHVLQDILKALVERRDTGSTRIALTLAEVAERAGLETVEAEEKLKQLASFEFRLVRSLRDNQRYELAHESLIPAIEAWPESPERTRVKAILDMLRHHLRMGEMLSRDLIGRVQEEKENSFLKFDCLELELLLRSALAAGYEAEYWFERAATDGVEVQAIALEGLKAENFRARAAAVGALARLGKRFIESLTRMLADPYPQVRVAAIQALEGLQPSGEWRARLKYECYVPAGRFVVGDNENAYLNAYYIGKYPVTNADYWRYMQDREQAYTVPVGKEQHPVVNVNWYDARQYAAWAGMRLLTEVEWEKAASWVDSRQKMGDWIIGRIVDKYSDDGKKLKYPWGDAFDNSKCNTSESGIGGTTPVGKYSPGGDSPYGCVDMAGNVWEWTSSLKQDNPYVLDNGRDDPGSTDRRIVRGGSWNTSLNYTRCTHRRFSYPNGRFDHYGLRCGVTPARI